MRQSWVSGLAVLVAVPAIGASASQGLISQYELQVDTGVPRFYRLVIPLVVFLLTLLVLRLSRAPRKFLLATGVIAGVAFAGTVMGMLSDTMSIGGGLLWMAGQALSVVVGALLLVLAVLPAFQEARARADRRSEG